VDLRGTATKHPEVDRDLFMRLARDLPAAWNAPSTDMATKQRLIRVLVQEVVCELDDTANEVVLLIHWTGGRHTEVRVPRVKTGRYPVNRIPAAVDALQQLADHLPDKEIAVSLNRMRCKTSDGATWTTVRVREMRERLGIPEHVQRQNNGQMICLMKAAERLGICVGSARVWCSAVCYRPRRSCRGHRGSFQSPRWRRSM
jgi:hypothetical protein